MIKLLKIVTLVLFILGFGLPAKAQQLIITPNFKSINNMDTNDITWGSGVFLYDTEINSFNPNLHIKTFVYGYRDSVLSHGPPYYGYLTPYSLHFKVQTPVDWRTRRVYLQDSIRSFMIIKHQNAYIPKCNPYDGGYNSLASIGGVSFELSKNLSHNKIYFLKFYSQSLYLGYCAFATFKSSGLNIGISNIDTTFGNKVLSAMPIQSYSGFPAYPAPPNESIKIVSTFKATDTAKYLTVMGDFDTSTESQIGINNFSLYPAFNLGTRNMFTCKGDSVKLTALVTGNSYDWSSLDDTQSIYVKDSGWYVSYIYHTDSVLVDSIHVMYKNIIINTTKDTLICQGSNTVLQSTNTKIGNKYLWSTTDTISLIQINNSGVFWVATTTNSNCTKVDTFNVQAQTPIPLPLPRDTIFCKAGNYILNAYNNNYNKYLWNTLDTTPSITITNAGKYFVTASNNVCKITDTINVQIFNLPQLKINDTSFCNGGSCVLNVANLNYTKYLWSTKDTASFIIVHDSGTYIVTASNGACTTTDTIHVSIINLPPINLVHDTTICDGNTLTLNATNSAYKTYLWNTGATTPQIKVANAGKYIVTANNGTCNIKDSTILSLYALPYLHLPADTIVCLSQLGAVILDAGKFKSYYWYPTGERTQKIAAVNPEIYMVVVTDSNNCIGSDSTLIDDNCPYKLYMPNAFTPNNDLVNETFKGYGLGIAQFEMHIYNRWGEELFSTTDMNIGWDGTFKNNPCMADTYVWQITYRLKNETSFRTEKGTVMLLK